MTLAEVAARMRAEEKGFLTSDAQAAWLEHAVLAFEADPEFKLPERLEALEKAYAWNGPDPGYRSLLSSEGWVHRSDVARSLREVREARP